MERNKARVSKFFEIGVSGFLFLFSCFMLRTAIATDKPVTDGNLTSMAFPKVLYVVIILMTAYLIVMAVIWLKNHPADKTVKATVFPIRSVVTFAMIVIYALAWKVIGFSLSTLIFFFSEAYYLDRKRPIWLTALLAIAATVIMYVVFGIFFKVSFPDKLMNMIRGI